MSTDASFSPTTAARPRLGFSPAMVILVCAVALTILGLTILFSASASYRQGPYYYLNKQFIGVGFAVAGCLLAGLLDFEYVRRYAWFVGGAAVVALLLVLVPHVGIAVKGSRRWLGIGFLRLQVSEFAKLAMVFCLAHYLALNQTRISEFRRGFVYPLGIIGVFAGLILLEPDFGTAALTVAVGLSLLFLAGARWRYIVPTLLAVGGLFAVMVALNPNRARRFTAFLDVEGNKMGGTYQLYQALASFAAGGAEGAGLGQGRQQLNFLPEAHTDFIFAVVAEELGLVFTMGVVALFAAIFIAGWVHLRRAPNLFQYLLVAGALLLICLQAIINLGVVTGLFPTKGMSLPFLSAGLSNLILMGLLVGIFINTQRNWGRAVIFGEGRKFREVLS